MKDSFNYVYPVFALVGLTFIVLLKMFYDRVQEMRTKKIHPQRIADSKKREELLEDKRGADNFRNLFEAPVFFYILAILTIQFEIQSNSLLILMWLYVASRVAHSFIHCTYNKVYHRFYAYAASTFILIAMWIHFMVSFA